MMHYTDFTYTPPKIFEFLLIHLSIILEYVKLISDSLYYSFDRPIR